MNPLNCCLLITSSLLVLFLIDTATASADMCVFKCLKGVIKCKRDRNVPGLLPPGTDCCGLYSECYMRCKPNAASVPPCTQKSKRGSWNKRPFSSFDDVPLGLNRRAQEPVYPGSGAYYRDALNFMLQPSADDLE